MNSTIRCRMFLLPLVLLFRLAWAAPAEDELGRSRGYPAAPNLARAYQEGYMVGSFSAMDSLGPHCSLPPAGQPPALPKAAAETVFRYRFQGREYTLDDYLQRQRATAVLVLKDGEIVTERYSYDRTPAMRMISHSMAKTVLALGVMKALEEGLIRSLDDTAAAYVPALKGSLYGETRLVNLLRMASGVRYVEDYTPKDDRARFNGVARRLGIAEGLRIFGDRESAEGTQFNYGGAQTATLGLVLRAASGKSLCEYIGEKIWQPLGAESRATWMLNDADGVEQAQGGFNATVRDYARLGWMLALDGEVNGRRVLSAGSLLDMTDPARQPAAFRPGSMQNKGSTYYGYGFQVWLSPGTHRRFVLLGIHGQAILVDPELKLVVVHTAAGRDASGDASGHHLGQERDALFRGIVAKYGRW